MLQVIPLTGRFKVYEERNTYFSIRGPYDRDHTLYGPRRNDTMPTNMKCTGFMFPSECHLMEFGASLRRNSSSGYIWLRVRLSMIDRESGEGSYTAEEVWRSDWLYLDHSTDIIDIKASLNFEIPEGKLLSMDVWRDSDTGPSYDYVYVTGGYLKVRVD